jgi:hypothetical protein
MQAIELDQKINSFLTRKAVQFPDLALSGRHETRTVKYPEAHKHAEPKLFFSRNHI